MLEVMWRMEVHDTFRERAPHNNYHTYFFGKKYSVIILRTSNKKNNNCSISAVIEIVVISVPLALESKN